jgi:hypothetical protein
VFDGKTASKTVYDLERRETKGMSTEVGPGFDASKVFAADAIS